MSQHVCDFETASQVDLRVVGAWAYAEHPTTEVLCLSFEDEGGVYTWRPSGDPALHLVFCDLVDDPNAIFVSHGDFERAIWRCIMVPIYGFPDIPNERWSDTMAVAAMKQLPLDLDKLTMALRLPTTKDREGSAFTRKLSKPDKKTGMLDRSPASLKRAYDYCESDVRAERSVLDRVGDFQPGERAVWLMDQTINQRGIKIDLDYVASCQRIVAGATKPLAAEFSAITGGLEFTQVQQVTQWINDQGVSMPDLTKGRIAAMLGGDIDEADEDDDDPALDVYGEAGDSRQELPGAVRRCLEIRQKLGSASIKKLPRMAACVSSDQRARGLLQYHRAGPGRWAGRILQPQNFPRPTLRDDDGNLLAVDTIVDALQSGDWEYVEMMLGHGAIESVVTGLRHALIADKSRVFISGDFAQIEARIVLALAGQHDKVKLFQTGTPYIDMATQIYGRPISKKNDVTEYTIGKNTVLGCGFQMGDKRFHERYCPQQPMEFATRVIRVYRNDWAPMVPSLWYALEGAANDTVWTKQPHEAYGVRYALEDGWLTARLPSGRKLYYWNPQPVRRTMPWKDRLTGEAVVKAGFTYQAVKQGRWKTVQAFGGLLTENVVQGLARDLLVIAMFKLEANGFPLVLTVHDEAVGEPLLVNADELAFRQIMEDTPEWAKAIGIPVAAETWAAERYRK